MLEEVSTPTFGSPSPSQCRLFLLNSFRLQAAYAASWLGLAPSATREGDFICHLHQTDEAVVVRKDDNHYTLIGMAVVAKDRATTRKPDEDRGEAPRFAVPYTENRGTSGGSDVIPLYMDLAMAYELSTYSTRLKVCAKPHFHTKTLFGHKVEINNHNSLNPTSFGGYFN